MTPGDARMPTPGRFTMLGLGAISCTRTPACISVRCMSTAHAVVTAPSPNAPPSGVREALQLSLPRQHTQVVSSFQVQPPHT